VNLDALAGAESRLLVEAQGLGVTHGGDDTYTSNLPSAELVQRGGQEVRRHARTSSARRNRHRQDLGRWEIAAPGTIPVPDSFPDLAGGSERSRGRNQSRCDPVTPEELTVELTRIVRSGNEPIDPGCVVRHEDEAAG